MARRATSGSFKKGNPGGPGRRKVPDDLKRIRKVNAADVERTIDKYLRFSVTELKQVIKDQAKTTVLDQMICRTMVKAMNKGDQYRLDFLLNRTIGKVPIKVAADLGESFADSLTALALVHYKEQKAAKKIKRK